MVSPLKMKYSGKATPAGVDGISMGKNGKGLSTPTKVMKGPREAGEKYKKPGNLTLRGKNAKDMSSGQSNPYKGGDDNKKRYAGVPQPMQYSNEATPRKTKFVC